MTGVIDAAEREVAILAHYAADVGGVGYYGSITCGAEKCWVGTTCLCGNGQGDGFSTEPIADVVSITIHEAHANSGVEKGCNIGNIALPFIVSGRSKGLDDLRIRLGIIDW